MQHITVKEFGNGFFKLTPEKGYKLRLIGYTDHLFSEAITKNIESFEAIEV